MKIFQILNGRCHWDATSVVKTLKEASERFASTCFFVEAPSYVQEGWLYDQSKNGDERFINSEVEVVENDVNESENS